MYRSKSPEKIKGELELYMNIETNTKGGLSQQNRKGKMHEEYIRGRNFVRNKNSDERKES